LSKEDIAVEKAKEVISNIDGILGDFAGEDAKETAPLFLVYTLAMLISRISGGDTDKMGLATELFDQAMEMAKRSSAYAEDKRREYADG
jgi:hypothetical protein